MADLQFHSNHCYGTESARGTAEESRPQQDRERVVAVGENFTGVGKRGCTDSKVSEQKVSNDISVKKKEMELWRKWIESSSLITVGGGGRRLGVCEPDQCLRLDTGTCLQDERR